MLMDLKLCKDCENYVYARDYSHNYWYEEVHLCFRLKNQDLEIDLVTGEVFSGKTLDCKGERKTGDCGPEGKYWAEKRDVSSI